MELTFVVTDSEGATTLLTPTVEICGCQNGGNCTTLGQDPSISAYVMSCSCLRGTYKLYIHISFNRTSIVNLISMLLWL